MYTYKPILHEDSAGQRWTVVLLFDGTQVDGTGTAKCEGSQGDQEKAVEVEAQRLQVLHEESLVQKAELEQKKAEVAAAILGITAKFDQAKPVPAIKAEAPIIEEQVAEISK